MAQSIDIEFYPDATAKCSNCGSVYTLGSSQKEINVEICGNCHPFYTGQDVMVDTAGRIERFQARLAKSQGLQQSGTVKKAKKVKTRAIRQTLDELIQDENKTPNEVKNDKDTLEKEVSLDAPETDK